MFDNWDSHVIRLRDDPVLIDTHKLWPGLDAGTFLSLVVRQHGLRIEAFHPGRLVAWVRRTSGGWLAVVEIGAHNGDGSAAMTATLLVPAGAVRIDRRAPPIQSTHDG